MALCLHPPNPAHHNPAPSDTRWTFAVLTLGEARRVVVDVGEGDADRGGPREAAHLARHVLGLDHHLVVLLDLAVHAGEGGLDQAWKEEAQGIRLGSFPGTRRFQPSDLCRRRQDGDAGAVIGRRFKRCLNPVCSSRFESEASLNSQKEARLLGAMKEQTKLHLLEAL